MNNQTPFLLYRTNNEEFLNKMCGICWSTLFFPEEEDNKMVHCCKLECDHMFHINCIYQSINSNHLNCPECRKPICTNKIKNIDLKHHNIKKKTKDREDKRMRQQMPKCQD